MANVLVVAAHPDDEVLGCGGTLLRRIENGDRVYSLVLGEGETSRHEEGDPEATKRLEALHRAHAEVCQFLGFAEHWLHDFPDNRFDSVDLLDIIKVVERVKEQVRPEVVFTHFENDLNIDHRMTFQAVLTACRPHPGESVREILCFETPSSTEWASPVSGGNWFRPNVFVDVARTMERKLQAVKMYQSELRPYPHPRSLEALDIISRRWGLACGLEHAEAFVLVRKIV